MAKKNLLLLPLALLAGSAFAQSNVTLFGVVDATLTKGSGSVSDRTRMTSGGLSSNRVGFRGTEDLGGGLKASFWLEMGFNGDDGTGQASNTNNQASGVTSAGLFNRRSTVSLLGTWGEVRLGRDYTPQYWEHSFGDTFRNYGVGSAINFTSLITGVASTRASNMISYFTPGSNGGSYSPGLLGGFGAQVSYYLGENASNVANADDGTGGGINVAYHAGPVHLGVGYGRTKYAAGNVVQRVIAGTYDFGVVKVLADINSDRNGARSARGFTVGVQVPVGSGIVKVAYSEHRLSNAGTDPVAKKMGVGYVHNLSKRTALYTSLARVRNSGGSALALNGAVTGPNQSSTGLDLGIRHAF